MKGDAVGIISERARDFLPYDPETRLRSVRRAAESGWSIRKALACYKAKRTSFWRRRKRYGGTDSSLADRRSHRPHSGHPRKAPKKTTCKIKCLRDQAKRKRLLHYANEHSAHEAVRGLKKAIAFFGYKPKEIQTDSGFELSGRARAKGGGFPAVCRDGPNFLERFCLESGMAHKLIRPGTPERNGKVERSHRIDQERFCRTLRFYSLADLASQGARWSRKYNDMPRMALKPRPPNQVEIEKLRKLMQDTGEARCPRLLKRFTSIEN